MNKGNLVDKLRKRGLSRRNAVHILNFILDEMAAALKHGEEVEFPFGSLKRVRHAHKQQQGHFLNRNTTIYKNRGSRSECRRREAAAEDHTAARFPCPAMARTSVVGIETAAARDFSLWPPLTCGLNLLILWNFIILSAP
jgi:nucleoid DNA-binding protein